MLKKVYTTGNVQQLIDLNEDLTNFKLKFTLSSKNGEEFDMVISDQHTIDNSPNELEFKRVKNTISGTIVSDKDVFQNHFLILKSATEKPAEVEVIINKKEIPPNPNAQSEIQREKAQREQYQRDQAQREQAQRQQLENEQQNRNQREDSIKQQTLREQFVKQQNESSTTWVDIKLIIVVVLCILVGIFIYNVVSNKSGITNFGVGNVGVGNVGVGNVGVGDLGSGVGVNNLGNVGVGNTDLGSGLGVNNLGNVGVDIGSGVGNIFGMNQNLFRKLNSSIPI
jgi:hypothetical protein